MSVTYMEHPDHGFMPVYDTGERDRVAKLGWKVVPDMEKRQAELLAAKRPEQPAEQPEHTDEQSTKPRRKKK